MCIEIRIKNVCALIADKALNCDIAEEQVTEQEENTKVKQQLRMCNNHLVNTFTSTS